MSPPAPEPARLAPSAEPPPLVLWCDADAARRERARRLLGPAAALAFADDLGAASARIAAEAPHLLVVAGGAAAGAEADALAALRQGRAEVMRTLVIAPRGGSAAPAADDVLAEPFSDAELLARTRAQLEIAALRRALAERRTESDTWLGLALKAAGLGVWHSRIGSGELHIDANLAAMFGLPAQPTRLGEAEWLAAIHPEDRANVLAELAARRADHKPLEIDFRTLGRDGTVRWLAVMGSVVRTPAAGAEARASRSIGVARDVTDRKRDADRQQLLMAELNHRVRNSLATVLALATQTARSAASVPEFVAAFQARVMALAAAHGLLTRYHWEGASLGELADAILAPERRAAPDRFSLAGPDCALTPPQALALTMALHELATNARKYGALSAAEGRVTLAWSVAPGEGAGGARRLRLAWTERGGPRVSPPTRTGFGTRLLQRALGSDLDGSVALEFDPAGLRCTIEFPLGRGAR